VLPQLLIALLHSLSLNLDPDLLHLKDKEQYQHVSALLRKVIDQLQSVNHIEVHLVVSFPTLIQHSECVKRESTQVAGERA